LWVLWIGHLTFENSSNSAFLISEDTMGLSIIVWLSPLDANNKIY